MLRLEEWYIAGNQRSPYDAPELWIPCLCGRVYDHPLHEDGKELITSAVIGKTNDGKIRTRSGSLYELGKVREDYYNLYPNAMERLLKTLKETI